MRSEILVTDSEATQPTRTVQHRPRLRARLSRHWRSFGTGLCFVLYGAVAWLAGLTVLPLMLLRPGSAEARQRRVRSFVSASFRALLAFLALLGVGRVEIEGREWLKYAQGKLLIANHPMYLDVVALVGLLPQANCVIKQSMWENPWYRRFVNVLGYIGNASNHGLVDDCAASIRRGRSLILFPEGTRSTPDEPLAFLRGAARVALRSGCEILPVVIRCEPLALGKNQSWHDSPERPWRLRITVHPPVTLQALGWQARWPRGVAARRITSALQVFYRRQLATPSGAASAAISMVAEPTTLGSMRGMPQVLARRDTDDAVEFDLLVPPDCPWFEGHFPGQPILPGVVQIGWAISFAGQWRPQSTPPTVLEKVKFKHPIRPGARLTLRLATTRGGLRYDYTAHQPAGPICASSGTLARAPSATVTPFDEASSNA